jgi:hypothetical protein
LLHLLKAFENAPPVPWRLVAPNSKGALKQAKSKGFRCAKIKDFWHKMRKHLVSFEIKSE